MRELFELLDKWQKENNKRFLSLSVGCDRNMFCGIAITNPTEVMIVDETTGYTATVWHDALAVNIANQ
jgi:hypothetical protein